MSKSRTALIGMLVGVAVLAHASPSAARAVPGRISALAVDSVLAVEGSSQMRTAFAFGDPATVLASSPPGVNTRLVAASGHVANLVAIHREGELVIAHLSGLKAAPLRASAIQRTKAGMPAYVLGPPLGYEARRLRFVRLPPIDLRRARRAVIDGRLPRSARGAPVVTERGRLLGAVATVAPGKWTLEPTARLRRLLAGARAKGSTGAPILLVLACAFALVVVIGGLLVALTRRRHRRAFELSAIPPAENASHAASAHQPIVRLRESAPSVDEEFEVVVKSREGS